MKMERTAVFQLKTRSVSKIALEVMIISNKIVIIIIMVIMV
jgi:hypothetical protein